MNDLPEFTQPVNVQDEISVSHSHSFHHSQMAWLPRRADLQRQERDEKMLILRLERDCVSFSSIRLEEQGHLDPQAGHPDTAPWPPGGITLCCTFVCFLPSTLNTVQARTLSGFCTGSHDAAPTLAPGGRRVVE